MTGCPSWCLQTTPHGIHQSAVVILPRDRARWNISLGQVDDTAPHVTIVYLGEVATADAHWQIPLAAAGDYARFAARLGEAQVAAAITTTAERARELVKA